jgi:peptidyl-prolyl cis-trans isomerase A (cyclophilin A)
MKSIASLILTSLVANIASAANPVVVIKTNMGDITVELDQEKAPVTVANFLQYVENKHFDGTVFHRVIGTFMIQGGGFAQGNPPTEKSTLPPIRNEARTSGLSNLRGTIAMARTSAPHSATSQFFINVADNKNLDPGGFSPDGYAVFGKVTDGMETVDQIKNVKTHVAILRMQTTNGRYLNNPSKDVPVEQVLIESVTLKKAAAPEQ